jgi:hypothetical protein
MVDDVCCLVIVPGSSLAAAIMRAPTGLVPDFIGELSPVSCCNSLVYVVAVHIH